MLLDVEFNDIAEEHKDLSIAEVDRTPAEIIAYQLGWLNLVMNWDRDEQAGKPVSMPHPQYKWNQLGAMYQSFYSTYSHYSLHELRRLLNKTEHQWQDWISTLSDDELFIQGMRQWTGTNPKWPMSRWIHINSAAPFKTFRAKIRKWKKYRPQV